MDLTAAAAPPVAVGPCNDYFKPEADGVLVTCLRPADGFDFKRVRQTLSFISTRLIEVRDDKHEVTYRAGARLKELAPQRFLTQAPASVADQSLSVSARSPDSSLLKLNGSRLATDTL